MKRIIVFVTAGLALASICCAKPAAQITPEDLLCTSFTQYDANQLLPDPQNWWPELPAFWVGMDGLPGKRFHVAWNYSNIADGCGNLQVATNLFQDEQTARDGFKSIAEEDKQNATIADGPKIGDECQYITRKGDDGKFETMVRYRVRETVGRVNLFLPDGFAKPEEVAKLAVPVVHRINWLLDGKLATKLIPAETEALLPPAQAADLVGPVMGTAVIPLNAWASTDTFGNPKWVQSELMNGGVTQLALRRYAVRADADHVVEVNLFAFADEESASKFVQRFIKETEQHIKLNPGRTGSISACAYNKDLAYYELQFAKGRIACDVCGFAPFADTLPLVEKPVRELAELWYKSLH